jgi:hypothetical protein
MAPRLTRKRGKTTPGTRAQRGRNVINRLPLPKAVRRTLFNGYIQPLKPVAWCSDPDKWLDNTNIEAVLRQYEKAYRWFRSLGVHPIDFSAPSPYMGAGGPGAAGAGPRCLVEMMCRVSIPQLRRDGIKYAAAVFNLDNHLQSGSHWVAAVIDVAAPSVFYFDSYGLPPPPQIETFMKSLANDAPELLRGRRIGFNGRRFQRGGTECGMYSLYFIISLIHGMPFRRFVKSPVPDRDMIALRDVLFADRCRPIA